jgi:acyl dehydratase
MSNPDQDDLPAAVVALIGKGQYEEASEFPVERGYVWTSCASVGNGNPLYWSDEIADEVTGGFVAPPTTISLWLKPHFWSPGFTGERLALPALHDLKEMFGLPEAIITENSVVFHELVRPGDVISSRQVLRSVSAVKTTRLGTGRFWTIDVEYENQRGECCAVESYTAFAYHRGSE